MAKGSACSSSRLVCDMISCNRCCACALRFGSTMKPMPPPDMPPSIQKPQKSAPNSARTDAMSDSVKALLAHGMMVWIGSRKLRVVRSPTPRTSPARSADTISSSNPMACCRPAHSAAQRSRYFSVTISRIGPTFCAMPPWTSTRLCCKRSRVSDETSR